VHIRVQRLDPDLPLPHQQHPDDAGYDLHAREAVTLAPGGGRGIVPTGLALNHGITCLNTPGLIDPLYRGELKVLLVNTDPAEPYTVSRGDRIAQLVVQRVEMVEWVAVDELDATVRDTFGFGSTGR